MKISQASKASGLPVKTIRYYESIGLFTSKRLANGYRVYSKDDVEQMHFLFHSRELGFSLEECRDLLSLFRNPDRASKNVKAVANQRLELIDKQIEDLLTMKATLANLVKQCPGNDDPDCVILKELAK